MRLELCGLLCRFNYCRRFASVTYWSVWVHFGIGLELSEHQRLGACTCDGLV